LILSYFCDQCFVAC